MAQTTDDLNKLINWYGINAPAGKTIKFTEVFKTYGHTYTREYRGISAGIKQEGRTLILPVYYYLEDGNKVVYKEFNVGRIKDVKPSRLPKEITEPVRQDLERRNSHSASKVIYDELLSKNFHVSSYRREDSTFLCAMKAIDWIKPTITNKQYFNLTYGKDIAGIKAIIPDIEEKLEFITDNHFGRTVVNKYISITPYLIVEPDDNMLVVYQSVCVKVLRKLSPSEIKEVVTALKNNATRK